MPFNNVALNIISDTLGNEWIGTSEGILKFDGNSWKKYNSSDWKFEDDHVDDLALESQNNLWFIINSTLVKFDGTTWTKFITPKTCWESILKIDMREIKWIGNRDYEDGLGLLKFDGNVWTIYDSSN